MINGWKTTTDTGRRFVAVTALALLLGQAAFAPVNLLAREQPAAAGEQGASPAPEALSVDPATPEPLDQVDGPPQDEVRFTWSRPVVRVGQDYELRAGERAREVIVVFGSATIAGEVDRDVVVVFGAVRLLPTARIHGSLVATGGGVTIEDGATVGRDFVVTAGGVDAPPSFHPGADYIVVGVPGLARQGEALVPWFTRGLLWGRLIVPSVGWLWPIVAVIVLVYLALALLFDRPVRMCRDMLAERPLSAFLVGLLTLVLVGPVSFILAVSVIGIPVIPFVACGLLIAALLGKVGLSRWIGSRLVAESDPDSRGEAVRSFLLGSVVILLAYMVPVLGILVWVVGGIFGLGAAMLAFSSGLRRENSSRRRVPPPAVATTPPIGEPVAPVVPPTAYAPLTADSGDGAGTTSAPADEVSFVPPPVSSLPPRFAGAGVAGQAGVDLAGMPKAPFLDRLAAFALDVLLVSIAYNLLDMYSARAFFTILLGYHIIFWGLKATTVGGIICNLRVVRTDGAPLTFTDALIRGFSSIFSIAALGIGCLWILFDPDNQAWHDRFAGTWVVKVPKNWPV